MWKKTINNLDKEKIPSMINFVKEQNLPLICSFHDKNESENVINILPIIFLTGLDLNNINFINFCVYENVSN